MRKIFKATRSFKARVVVNTEFLYKGPIRKIGFRYSGPPWIFLATVVVLGTVVLGVLVAKW